MIGPTQKIQENFKNVNLYHIKDNNLDIQDQQWSLIFYLKLAPIWRNKKISCKKTFLEFFFLYDTEFFRIEKQIVFQIRVACE